MNFSKVEKEIIYLKAIAEIIDEMVNFEVFDLLGKDPNSQISFNSATHRRYFNIVLLDFLSPSDPRVVGEKKSYLDALREISENPSFNQNGSIQSLAGAAKKFGDWLNHEFEYETWLPSINKNVPLSIRRGEFLKICGNISKHNFSRLGSVGKELRGILERNGVDTDMHGALLTLYDFYQHFHDNLLDYHARYNC